MLQTYTNGTLSGSVQVRPFSPSLFPSFFCSSFHIRHALFSSFSRYGPLLRRPPEIVRAVAPAGLPPCILARKLSQCIYASLSSHSNLTLKLERICTIRATHTVPFHVLTPPPPPPHACTHVHAHGHHHHAVPARWWVRWRWSNGLSYKRCRKSHTVHWERNWLPQTEGMVRHHVQRWLA